jgi:ferric-dicitrate binding protein FerR (iron transport regulator)
MTFDKHDLDGLLAQASIDVRRDTPAPQVVEEAAARVWARLQEAAAAPRPGGPGEQIRGCEGVQALLSAFVAGTLPPARALLVDDHTRECVPCRRALHAVRAGQPLPVAVASGVRRAPLADERRRLPRWALATAATLLVAAGTATLLRDRLFGPPAPVGRVEVVEGALLGVEGEQAASLAAGAPVVQGRALRTAKGSRSLLRLADGSTIEMRERAEIALAERVGGTTIELARGDIIVHAAPQRRRQLYVSTGDCLVSVTGTIFTVSRGTKGSRVGVIEGEVRVARGRQTSVLRPGEQIATHASLTPVSLSREVAWSRDADTYLALLRELTALGRQIDEQVSWPGTRTSTRLLDLAPAGTVVYAGLPNVSQSLADAHALLLQRVGESAALGAWWRETMESAGADQRLAEVIERLRGFGSHLGEEVVIAVPVGQAQAAAEDEDLAAPVVLAEIARPASFPDVLAAEVARLEAESGGKAELVIVDDPATAAPAGECELYLWADGDLFAASPSLELLRQVAAVRRGGASAFAGTDFHARLTEAYREGAGWLLGVDLATFAGRAAAAHAEDPEERLTLERMGLLEARHLVVERKEHGELAENRAVVSFAGPRRGVASWLAAPAPMGSLDFVSPEANLAAAFVVKTPTALLDDLFALVEAGDPDFAAHLAEFEQREGVDVRRDLGAALGGELAFAFDGPMLPVPSWKLVLEVYDPARLQATLERLAERVNREAAEAGEPGLELGSEDSGGRTFYSVTFVKTGLAVHYVYVDGYLVAAPSRALLERAIQSHDTGYSIAGGEEFTALLPEDGEANFSAVVFQHLGPALQPLLGLMGGRQGLTAEQQQAFEQLAAESPASLAYAYGEEDRIVMATRGSGLFGFNLGALMGLRSVLGGLDGDGPASDDAGVGAPAPAPRRVPAEAGVDS